MSEDLTQQILDTVDLVQRVAAKRQRGEPWDAADDKEFTDIGCQCPLCKEARNGR